MCDDQTPGNTTVGSAGHGYTRRNDSRPLAVGRTGGVDDLRFEIDVLIGVGEEEAADLNFRTRLAHRDPQPHDRVLCAEFGIGEREFGIASELRAPGYDRARAMAP